MACSGLNSPPGSHQRAAMASNLAISSASMLECMSGTLGGETALGDARMPGLGTLDQAGLIQAGEAAFLQEAATRHPYVAHLLAVGGIDQRRYHVVHRLGRGCIEIDS